jgi:hypothetical protein
MLYFTPAICGSPAMLPADRAEEEFWKEVAAIIELCRANSYDGGKTASGFPEITNGGKPVVPFASALCCALFGEEAWLALQDALSHCRPSHGAVRRAVESVLLADGLL